MGKSNVTARAHQMVVSQRLDARVLRLGVERLVLRARRGGRRGRRRIGRVRARAVRIHAVRPRSRCGRRGHVECGCASAGWQRVTSGGAQCALSCWRELCAAAARATPSRDRRERAAREHATIAGKEGGKRRGDAVGARSTERRLDDCSASQTAAPASRPWPTRPGGAERHNLIERRSAWSCPCNALGRARKRRVDPDSLLTVSAEADRRHARRADPTWLRPGCWAGPASAT